MWLTKVPGRAAEASAALRTTGLAPYWTRMKVKLLAFAHARELLGFSERALDCDPSETPHALLARIAPDFTAKACRVAVDGEYHDWDKAIGEAVEIALIPPVSGG
jgi:molybdopterin synthase sulfur carrier subunit